MPSKEPSTPVATTPKTLFSLSDIAEYYGRSRAAVHRWRRAGLLPPPDVVIGAGYEIPETTTKNGTIPGRHVPGCQRWKRETIEAIGRVGG